MKENPVRVCTADSFKPAYYMIFMVLSVVTTFWRENSARIHKIGDSGKGDEYWKGIEKWNGSFYLFNDFGFGRIPASTGNGADAGAGITGPEQCIYQHYFFCFSGWTGLFHCRYLSYVRSPQPAWWRDAGWVDEALFADLSYRGRDSVDYRSGTGCRFCSIFSKIHLFRSAILGWFFLFLS